jgi:hypothetical protein
MAERMTASTSTRHENVRLAALPGPEQEGETSKTAQSQPTQNNAGTGTFGQERKEASTSEQHIQGQSLPASNEKAAKKGDHIGSNDTTAGSISIVGASKLLQPNGDGRKHTREPSSPSDAESRQPKRAKTEEAVPSTQKSEPEPASLLSRLGPGLQARRNGSSSQPRSAGSTGTRTPPTKRMHVHETDSSPLIPAQEGGGGFSIKGAASREQPAVEERPGMGRSGSLLSRMVGVGELTSGDASARKKRARG